MQVDGKVVVGGDFHLINGVPRNHIGRLNANGSLDTSFTGTGADNRVHTLAMQADGKIMVGGEFTTMTGTSRVGIARLNANGSLDPTFDPGTGTGGVNREVSVLAVQADGKVLLGGKFVTFNGATRNRIARLNPDGSLDTPYVSGPGANNTVRAIALQADGKTLLGGYFTNINSTTCTYVARLGVNGLLDATFNCKISTNSCVNALAIQADQKILLGGDFTTINGTARSYIARLNANGSLDPTFTPGSSLDNTVYAVAVQTDGKVLVGGAFTSAHNGIARLNPDGSLDATFNPGTGADYVYALALQSDGKIVLGGDFTNINDTEHRYFGRLNANGSLDNTFDPGGKGGRIRGPCPGDSARWQGAAGRPVHHYQRHGPQPNCAA